MYIALGIETVGFTCQIFSNMGIKYLLGTSQFDNKVMEWFLVPYFKEDPLGQMQWHPQDYSDENNTMKFHYTFFLF